jgi:membrane protease YdiL (CAAX protease family)
MSILPSPAASGGLVQTMRRHPVVSFFLLTYAVSWSLWIPMLLLHLPMTSELSHTPTIYLLPGIALGVTGSAFLMTALTQGKAGVLRLLQRFVLWRVGWQWYAFAILGIPLIEVLIGFVLPGGQDALHAFSPAALLLYPVAYISHFYFGPLFEEAGWRGFALPRLQQQRGPLVGTLILGFLWGVWHLPVYLPQDIQADGVVGGLLNFALFVLLTMALAFIFTWVFNNTKGSLLLVILLHGSIDGTSTYIQVLADRHLLSATAVANILQLGFLPGCIVLALLLIVFTRGRLSYQRYQQEAESLDLPPSMEQKPAPPDTAV